MSDDADRLAGIRKRARHRSGPESHVVFLLRMLDYERDRPRGKHGQPMLTENDLNAKREEYRRRLKAKG